MLELIIILRIPSVEVFIDSQYKSLCICLNPPEIEALKDYVTSNIFEIFIGVT